MEPDKTIEVISSKLNNYYIKHSVHGFYAEVRTRNWLQLMKEYYHDFIGLTYKHPVFLSSFHYSTIDSMKWLINIHVNIDLEQYNKQKNE